MSLFRSLQTPALLHELINLLARNGIHPDRGRRFMPIRSIDQTDSPYPVADDDCAILADATSGTTTVTLPSAADFPNRLIVVKRIQSGGSNVIISRAGSDTIEGSTSVTLTSQYAFRFLISDGSATWYVLSST